MDLFNTVNTEIIKVAMVKNVKLTDRWRCLLFEQKDVEDSDGNSS